MSTVHIGHTRTGDTAAGRTVAAMVVGLLLTVVALAAPIVDQLGTHGLEARLRTVYAGAGVEPPPAVAVTGYLVVVGLLGVLGWLTTIHGVRRGRRWARPVATALVVVGLAVAVVDLSAAEYGAPILPTWLGVLGLLPCLAGLVAVVLSWRGAATGRVA